LNDLWALDWARATVAASRANNVTVTRIDFVMASSFRRAMIRNY
jgi:hypothetical protein